MNDTAPVAGDVHPDLEDHPGEHFSDRRFVNIFFLLVVLTAVEVLWSYLPIEDTESDFGTFIYWGGLLGMMSFKFFIIDSYFMHLKFDNKILTRVFYAGLFLAVGVYFIALMTFQLFSSAPAGFAP